MALPENGMLERTAWFVLAMALWLPGELGTGYSLANGSLPGLVASVATWGMAFWAVEIGVNLYAARARMASRALWPQSTALS